MDEDKERKLAEASGQNPDVTDIANRVHNRLKAFDIGNSGFMAEGDKVLQGNRSSDGVFKDDDFEQVCLEDQEKAATSLDSFSNPESGYSPVNSPRKPKPKATLPNVSPELLHLVDSAIMGKPESFGKLKNVVSGIESFGSGEESEAIAFLVIDSLIATMGGVESFEEDEDSNPPSVMLNSRAAIVSGELIPWLPTLGDSVNSMSPRTRMVRGLLVILRSCTRNRAMCSTAGLLGVLLQSVKEIISKDSDMKWNSSTVLLLCIQHLAGHSLSVDDLHSWLQVIKSTLTTAWSSPLMLALEKAMSGKESRGPACTFEFDGESSGLLGPGESHWPFTNGYTFATWIYIESFSGTMNAATAAAAKSGKTSATSAGEGTTHMPRLFSFLSADNQGIEAYFHAQFLVVESGSGKGRKSFHFTHAFKPQCWYFIGLEQSSKQGVLGNAENELRLFIDGSLYETHPYDFPRISKPLSFCCIGSNAPQTVAGQQRRRRRCPMFAEMGPVYIFKEAIGPEKMARLASRGGDVLPCFGNGAGVPCLTTNDHVRNRAEESSILDADIGGYTHLLYHPCLLSGRFCPDASLSGAAGTLRRPAEVLGQVHVATRMKPVESFWALAYGGPMSLLPLTVSNVHKDSLEPCPGNLPLSFSTVTLAAPVFRMISVAIQHPGNNEELCRTHGAEILAKILSYLLHSLASLDRTHAGVGEEELVAAVVSLCQSQKINHVLKVQLFRTLLFDLKIWSLCNYGLQKKLLSSLQDMVFTEATAMRNAEAIQMLLDGCRRCYWTISEKDSENTFPHDGNTRQMGEVNALIDELLVIIELLMGAASTSLAADDLRQLLGFIIDTPQPNQVARVLDLIYRLVVQPNAAKAQMFSEVFIASGGIETFLVLLQREAKTGEDNVLGMGKSETRSSTDQSAMSEYNRSGSLNQLDSYPRNNEIGFDSAGRDGNVVEGDNVGSLNDPESVLQEKVQGFAPVVCDNDAVSISNSINTERTSPVSEIGGISLSISADNARNNVYNVDNSDAVVVGIIRLIGALISNGHLTFDLDTRSDVTSNILGSELHETGGTMFDDKVALLLFALMKAFQAAPNRLMTDNVYTTLLGASINASSTEGGLNFYDSGHHFEHSQLLLVLLRSLPFASKALQSRALQDLLFLACSHPENRSSMTTMEEWPEWILEILISNYERDGGKQSASAGSSEIEDLIHNFLIIMLEHSMRQKDGWMDIEGTIHCAEWLSIIGGSSTGEQRIRREESLPIFKRRLLGGLLDFSARELQAQTRVIAGAAAGVAAEGLSPKDAKTGAENAAQISVFLVENAIVILMLVEDHLRLQSKLTGAKNSIDASPSPLTLINPIRNRTSALTAMGESPGVSRSASLSSDSGKVPTIVQNIAPDWSSDHNYTHHALGRIWVLWKNDLSATTILKTSQLIAMHIKNESDQIFIICCIYASNYLADRLNLWNDLRQLAATHGALPMIILGDYNELLSASDHSSGAVPPSRHRGMHAFQNCVRDCDLLNLHSTGLHYTWTNNNPNNPIAEKIDRVLINSAWLQAQGQSYAHYEATGASDHARITVQLAPPAPNTHSKRKPFKYFTFWAEDQNFIPVVQQSWHSTPPIRHSRLALHLFQQKLKNLKTHLRTLNRTAFADITKQVQNARIQAIHYQEKVLTVPTETNFRSLHNATEDWNRLASIEEQLYQHKSRITWLKLGDKNTSYFHRVAKSRRSRNTIRSLTTDSGVVTQNQEEIKDIAETYFREFLQHRPDHLNPISDMSLSELITSQVAGNDATRLVAPITPEEIKLALLSMPSKKAPGPDGYPLEFYIAAWPVIAADFITAIQSFFMYGFLPRCVNSTLLALIPKGNTQTTVKDYRPISCLNTTYKVISKVLANRLKQSLPDLIEPNQSAFIKERLLLENVLLATELVKDYHRTSASSRTTLKLDISKAFDSLEWDFIIGVMRAMGFPDQFTHWIKICISTAMFSVVVNGDLAGYFPSFRGIRQGCSLSPYLYVIANNILSKQLNKAAANSMIGYHPYCRDLAITHLSFADDILVFTDGAPTSLTGILHVADHFASISGLHINKSKSSIFIGGRPSPMASHAQNHGLRIEPLPIRYLGLPLTTRSMKPADYEPLIDRIRQRLLAWSTKTLSYAGRLQLIKAVIMSITNFWLSAFKLPMKCLDKIERLCSNFLWTGTPTDHTKTKVNWQDICYPYNEGGLGVRSLRDTAQVFSLALIWRLACQKPSLWVSWTKQYLLRESTFWEVRRTSSGSWIWHKLLKLRHIARSFYKIKIGSGHIARFWSDPWTDMGALSAVLGEGGIAALGIQRHATVASAVRNNNWNFRRVRDPSIQAVIDSITRMQPPHEGNDQDRHLWRQGHDVYNDHFTSKNTWDHIRSRKPTVTWSSLIWFSQRVPRFSFILWLAIRDRLSTGSRMRTWGISQGCSFCNDPDETRDHLFFACPYSQEIWKQLSSSIVPGTTPPTWNSVTQYIMSPLPTHLDKLLLKIIFQATVYYIWKERNNRIHAETPKSEAVLISFLRSHITTHIQALDYRHPHRLATLHERWLHH